MPPDREPRRTGGSATRTPDTAPAARTEAELRAAAALETRRLEDAARAERLRLGLAEEPDETAEPAKPDKSGDKGDGVLMTTAKLGVAGTAVLTEKVVKTTGYLFSDFFTAIEKWGDEKLKKYPISRRVLGAGLIVASAPFVGWSYISGFWASTAGVLGGVAQFRDTRPSWREQDGAAAGKKATPAKKK